ncbi:MAG: FecR domain-containing protein, partial [Bacteroidota bacterium]
MKDDAQQMRQIARFLAGEMPATERASFEDWLTATKANQELFEESKAIWELTQLPPEEDWPVEIDASWERLNTQLPPLEIAIATKTPSKVKNIDWRRQLSRIAAVFLIGLGGLYWWSTQWVDSGETLLVDTLAGEKKEWLLPDGSKVWLNEDSRLEYHSSFDPRVLKLEGEAYFEVAKLAGKTFEIQTGATKTVVLGTAFNLRAYPDEGQVELVVNSGKVAFNETGRATKPLILEAGDTGRFDRPTQTLS